MSITKIRKQLIQDIYRALPKEIRQKWYAKQQVDAMSDEEVLDFVENGNLEGQFDYA